MGVKRRSSVEWRELVEAWSRSGVSAAEFAGAHGLSPATLGWWRWKLGTSRPVAEFLDVVVTEAAVASPDLIVEVGGVRVRISTGFDAQDVRRLVDALC
jgi:transposase